MRLQHVFALLAVVLGVSPVGAREPAPKQPVRVLLVTSAGGREVQFANLLLARDDDKKVELAVYTTTPLAHEAGTQLKHFPNLLRPADRLKDEEKAYNLSGYDVVVALDLDWTQVEPESLVLLQKWVERGGGLIASAGPVHTPKLAGGTTDDALQPVRDLLPVVFNKPDKQKVETSRVPVRLKFPEAKPDAPFLKLDPDGKGDLAGWDEFFGESEKKDAPPERGFYTCFPVASVKKQAVTLATFEAQGGKEQPWLAAHTVGKGRVIWIGSPEVYRLRVHSLDFYKRFWIEITRHAASAGRPK